MRVLKTILIILLVLATILVVLGLFAPSEFRVERSTVIKAPVSMVYAKVSSLNRMEEWGPWKEMEHNMQATLSGNPDGQVGAISHWKSDESEGEQELTELVPNERVRTALRFISPWEANNTGTFDLESMGDSTRITWGIEGQNNLMAKIASIFMNMDKAVGPMFEKGLANLKEQAEAEAAAVQAELEAKTFGGYVIETIERPAMVYIGKRNKNLKWADMKAFFSTNFMAVNKAMGAAGVQPAGAPSGVYFKWDEVNQSTDMMAAMPVASAPATPLKGFETYTAPAGKMLHIPYYGDYEKLGSAHEAMDAMIKANGLTHHSVVIEEYMTDPGAEPDTTKWLTNIYYAIK